MASVKLVLFTHKKYSDGSHPIFIQIIKDRKRKFIGIGHHAKKTEWDFENNLPKRNHPSYKRLKLLISQKMALAQKELISLENKEKNFSIDEVVRKIKPKRSESSLYNYIEEVMKNLNAEGKKGNARVYRTFMNVFKTFRKNKDIAFVDIDYKVLSQFENHLAQDGKKVNSISNYLRTFRAIYYRALKDNLFELTSNPFKEIKIVSEETRKRAISKEDIVKIKNLDLGVGTEYEKARDIFMFSFYLRGMSLVDILFVKVKDIIDGRINYVRKKTKQQFSIKLTEEANAIIKKYNNLNDIKSYIFPYLNGKKDEYLSYKNALRLINKKMKKIGEKAGLGIPLTTYVARHSWATIAKRSGISTAIISEGLGHETEQTTQIYLDSFENDVLDAANEIIIR